MASTKTVGRRREGLTGIYIVPGDKSITHRALFFGAVSGRAVIIRNPSPALDCRNTLELLRGLGYHILEHSDRWELDGTHPASHPDQLTLDCGNSGTTARLAAGFLTGERGEFVLIGDESLSRRPMERVAEPLRRIGGEIMTSGGCFPVSVIAKDRISGQKIQEQERGGSDFLEVGSAQVHAALVLAAVRSRSGVLLRRTKPMRDHTSRIAPLFGINIDCRGPEEFVHPLNPNKKEDGKREETIEIDVPGDPSSAAFLVAAALLVPGSDIVIEHVGLNPTRIAFLETLRAMGGDVEWSLDESAGTDHEPWGTIRVRYSPELRGVRVGEGDESEKYSVALMIDELPLLALVGACSAGETIVRGAGELRLKESDRIAATINLLESMGIAVEELEDGFRVVGPQQIRGGNLVDHQGDHRLAILAGVAGLIAQEPVTIPQPEVAAVSWPNVWTDSIFS